MGKYFRNHRHPGWDVYLSAQIDLFAQLFERRNSGLISAEYWGYWENGFWADWEVRDFARIFERNRDYHSAAFAEYVDSQIVERGLAGRYKKRPNT